MHGNVVQPLKSWIDPSIHTSRLARHSRPAEDKRFQLGTEVLIEVAADFPETCDQRLANPAIVVEQVSASR